MNESTTALIGMVIMLISLAQTSQVLIVPIIAANKCRSGFLWFLATLGLLAVSSLLGAFFSLGAFVFLLPGVAISGARPIALSAAFGFVAAIWAVIPFLPLWCVLRAGPGRALREIDTLRRQLRVRNRVKTPEGQADRPVRLSRFHRGKHV